MNEFNILKHKEGYWENKIKGEDNKDYIFSKGHYIDNVKNGYWQYYKLKNQDLLNSEGEFINGKENGYWKYYFDNGVLSTKRFYENGMLKGYCEDYSLSQEVIVKTFHL